MGNSEHIEQLSNIFTGKTIKSIQQDSAVQGVPQDGTGAVEVVFTDGTSISFDNVIDWRGGEPQNMGQRAASIAKAAASAIDEYRRKQVRE